MSTRIDHFLALVDAYRDASLSSGRKMSEARVSTLVIGSGNGIGRIRAGNDTGVLYIERKIRWFSDNWPVGAEWPADIPRPACAPPVDGDAA
jgi:hypothetical protein